MDHETSASARNRTRRFDPKRRDWIIANALEVIADVGVAGATHRLIAKKAEVPLGSMTYHFDKLDDVIFCAFERFTTELCQGLEVQLRNVPAGSDAVNGMLALVSRGTEQAQRRETLLILELYVLAIRDPKYNAMVNQWMASTRAAFARQFPATHAEVVDALIEGFYIHRTFSCAVPTEHEIRKALRALGETRVQPPGK